MLRWLPGLRALLPLLAGTTRLPRLALRWRRLLPRTRPGGLARRLLGRLMTSAGGRCLRGLLWMRLFRWVLGARWPALVLWGMLRCCGRLSRRWGYRRLTRSVNLRDIWFRVRVTFGVRRRRWREWALKVPNTLRRLLVVALVALLLAVIVTGRGLLPRWPSFTPVHGKSV